MENGNLGAYLKKNDLQTVGLLKLVSVSAFYDNILAYSPQLCNVAAGLGYRELLSLLCLHVITDTAFSALQGHHSWRSHTNEFDRPLFCIASANTYQSNILIDDSGQACLTDFGLSNLKAGFGKNTSYWTATIGGAIRWRAPELLPPFDWVATKAFTPILTTACDIFSYGQIVLQVRLCFSLFPYCS